MRSTDHRIPLELIREFAEAPPEYKLQALEKLMRSSPEAAARFDNPIPVHDPMGAKFLTNQSFDNSVEDELKDVPWGKP